MTTHAEDVLFAHLTDAEALQHVVESGFDYRAIPTEGMRKVVQWTVDYYADSDFALAPSREALQATWSADLENMDVELLPEDEDSDTIHWALKALNAQYANSQFQILQRNATIRVAEADQTEKVAEIAQTASELMNLSLQVQSDNFSATGALGIKQAIAKQKVRSAQDQMIQGMTLGLDQLDENFLGIRPGELCIAMGAQGSGKSLLSIMAALDNWERGKRVCLITLENSLEMTWDRLLVAGVNKYFHEEIGEPMEMRDWLTGHATNDQLQAAQKFMDMMTAKDTIHVSMPARGSRTPESLVNVARMSEADVMIIDQLTFLEYSGKGNKPKHEQLGDMLHTLKSLISTGARPIPCLLLHQLNRDGIKSAEKSGKISAYAAADSAEVERTADMLLAIYQSKVGQETNRMDMLCLKYRRGRAKDYQCRWHKGHVTGSVVAEKIDEDE